MNKTDAVEEFYDINYRVVDISKDFLLQLSAIDASHPEFVLPKKNNLIPTEFTIKKDVEEATGRIETNRQRREANLHHFYNCCRISSGCQTQCDGINLSQDRSRTSQT
jgi:secreted Zn-dependent insulinase-like peptidase